MQAKHIILVSILVTAVSCHKGTTPDPKPDPPANTNVIRLKDMNERNLPSPFYHFEYNDSGDITHASFSSGLGIYDVIYDGRKILRMENKNQPNGDTLRYGYLGSDIVNIQIIDKQGVTYRRAFLGYNTSHQLQTIDWEVKDGNVGFAQEQTLQFSYYPDSNLKELVNHLYTVGPQTAATFTDRFENYDNKLNVDAFSLLHRDQNHHLFLVPGIKIQLNNPRRNVRTGDGVNYEVDYIYSYDAAGRPLVKTGDVLWRSGADSGKHFETRATFSYYD